MKLLEKKMSRESVLFSLLFKSHCTQTRSLELKKWKMCTKNNSWDTVFVIVKKINKNHKTKNKWLKSYCKSLCCYLMLVKPTIVPLHLTQSEQNAVY